jgi:hypothetical protein
MGMSTVPKPSPLGNIRFAGPGSRASLHLEISGRGVTHPNPERGVAQRRETTRARDIERQQDHLFSDQMLN